MPPTKVRNVGSGYTSFNYRGQAIAFLDSVQDSGQRPIGGRAGAGTEGVIPLGAKHPVELVTSRVLNFGTLTVTIRELWNEPVWYQLAGLRGVGESITDVWEALARDPASVTCQKVIMPPGSSVWRGVTYHNCVVTDVDDREEITVDALTIAKGVTIAYTHKIPFTQPAGRR